MLNVKKSALLVTLLVFWSELASAEKLGSVNTEWKLMGSHQLVVEVFDDPKVEGVACHVSKPRRCGRWDRRGSSIHSLPSGWGYTF